MKENCQLALARRPTHFGPEWGLSQSCERESLCSFSRENYVAMARVRGTPPHSHEKNHHAALVEEPHADKAENPCSASAKNFHACLTENQHEALYFLPDIWYSGLGKEGKEDCGYFWVF